MMSTNPTTQMSASAGGVSPGAHRLLMGTLAFAWITATLFAATVAYGQEPPPAHKDRLNTPECQSAQRELEQSLATPEGRGQDEQIKLKLQVEKNRGVVASRCFDRLPDGKAEDAARRAASRPVSVAPIPPGGVQVANADVALRGAAAPAMPAEPVGVAAPTVLTQCDPGGCWDNQGRRLNGTGPVLRAPDGAACTSQLGVANCR